jgi:hypothetical protein
MKMIADQLAAGRAEKAAVASPPPAVAAGDAQGARGSRAAERATLASQTGLLSRCAYTEEEVRAHRAALGLAEGHTAHAALQAYKRLAPRLYAAVEAAAGGGSGEGGAGPELPDSEAAAAAGLAALAALTESLKCCEAVGAVGAGGRVGTLGTIGEDGEEQDLTIGSAAPAARFVSVEFRAELQHCSSAALRQWCQRICPLGQVCYMF